MPQLDVSTYTSQIFWLIVCFSALLIFSMRFSLPRIGRIFQQRWAESDGLREQALELDRQTTSLQHQIDQHLAEVQAKAHQEIVSATHRLSQESEHAKARIQTQFKEQLRHVEESMMQQQKSVSLDPQQMADTVIPSLLNKILQLPSDPVPVNSGDQRHSSYGH